MKLIRYALPVLFLGQTAFSAGNNLMVRGVGSGILYPAASQSLIVNPADLDETSRINVAGLYRMTDKDASVIASSKLGTAAGIGAGYYQVGTASVYTGGLGLHLGVLRLGLNFKSATLLNSGFNSDVGAILMLNKVRIGAVARDVNGRISRVDAGIGFVSSNLMFEVNLKKSTPLNTSSYLLDAALTTVAPGATLGFGYDTLYDTAAGGRFSGGSVHAGVSIGLGSNFFVEGFYRPIAQEWNAGKWSVGLRASL